MKPAKCLLDILVSFVWDISQVVVRYEFPVVVSVKYRHFLKWFQKFTFSSTVRKNSNFSTCSTLKNSHDKWMWALVWSVHTCMYIHTYIQVIWKEFIYVTLKGNLWLCQDFLLIACSSVAWLGNLSFRRQFQCIKREHTAVILLGANGCSHRCPWYDFIGLRFLPL